MGYSIHLNHQNSELHQRLIHESMVCNIHPLYPLQPQCKYWHVYLDLYSLKTAEETCFHVLILFVLKHLRHLHHTMYHQVAQHRHQRIRILNHELKLTETSTNPRFRTNLPPDQCHQHTNLAHSLKSHRFA